MYQIGDYVVKANSGLCRVEDILHLEHLSADKDRLYYLLVPVADGRAKIYTPTDSNAVTLRKALNSDKAWDLIHQISQIEEITIDNEKQRELKYKEALKSIDPATLVSIIKTMYVRNQERNAQGKKATAMDERYFRLAEDCLYSELAFAIGREKNEMKQIISEHINE